MAWEDRFAARFGPRALMAIAEVLRSEINKLRVKNGDVPYTQAQLEAALKKAWIDVGPEHDPPPMSRPGLPPVG